MTTPRDGGKEFRHIILLLKRYVLFSCIPCAVVVYYLSHCVRAACFPDVLNIPIKSFVIIYHDFLSTPRRGSHVKSDNTHTQSSRYTP